LGSEGYDSTVLGWRKSENPEMEEAEDFSPDLELAISDETDSGLLCGKRAFKDRVISFAVKAIKVSEEGSSAWLDCNHGFVVPSELVKKRDITA
jgi:hypothetical protein